MADSDFLIEIIARLRDEASPGLAKLKAEINSIKGTQDAERAERDLGEAIKGTGDEAERSKKKHEENRSELEKYRRAADDAGRGARSIKEDLESGFHSNIEAGKRARQDLGSDIDGLNKKMESLAVRRDELNKRTLLPNDVKAANELRESWADLDRQIKSVASSYSRFATSRKEGEEALRNDALKKSEAGFLEAAQARAEVEKLLKLVPASRQPTSVDTAAEVMRIKTAEKEAEAQREFALRVSETRTAWKSLESDLNSGSLSKGEAAVKVKQFSSELRGLAKNAEYGSETFKNLVGDIGRIDKVMKDPNFGSTGGFLRAFSRVGHEGGGSSIVETIDSMDHSFGSLGLRISGVSSFLRGFFDLAKIGLSQQLITGVLSLAGSLVSVASAAAQAGAALAGVFISGLGQAIPMLSIVAASLERFKNILAAVSVAGQAEQQHFYDPTEKQVLQLQQSSQLISANQQLSNSYIQLFEAQQRVRLSQIALTEARYTAQRQITELSLAEKNARLQAEGADISLTESRRQLQIAIQRGDVAGLQQAELAVKEAELSKKKTDFEIPKTEREARLARQRGVSGAPSVISAVQGLEGSRVAVLQAQQGAEAAQRQKQITQLQQQARSSKETQYEAQLKFYEKGMSPTELGLTNALIGIEKELKSPNSPLKKITDYMVEPFTNAIERIRSLLKTSSFLGPIDELAKAMGAGLSKLEKAAYGKEGTSFFEAMAKDASSNIPVVTGAIEGIMKLFEKIAKAADPAFHKLSADWNRFWESLNRKYSGNGLEKLTDFFNKSAEYAERFGKLAVALFDLFKAVGRDAAPQGIGMVNSFTEAIHKATEWVQSHGPEVTHFFKEAREGLGYIGNVLKTLGISLIAVFSVTSLSGFSRFIDDIILPGLRDVVTVLGKLTNLFINFFNLFGTAGLKVLEVIGVSGIIVVGIVKIIDMVKELKKAWVAWVLLVKGESWVTLLSNPMVAALTVVGVAIGIVVAAFSDGNKKNKLSVEDVNQALERQAEVLRTIKGLNNEYKSTQLAYDSSKLQTTSSERVLSKAQKEGPAQGETKAEYNERIASDKIQVQQNKLYEKEAHQRLTEMPKKQKEEIVKAGVTSESELNKLRENRNAVRGEDKSLKAKLTEEEEILGSPQKGTPDYKFLENLKQGVINKNRELKESEEKLGTALKENSERVKKSGEVISQSTEDAAKAAPRLSKAYGEAFREFGVAVGSGVVSAHNGMGKIRELVDNALKKYGVTPAELSSAAKGASSIASGASAIAGNALNSITGHATGAYIPATPGGKIARVGEGGHDEVVLSTDPAHAQRSRSLLGQYFSRAPHMASGGKIYTSPFHGPAPITSTDQGIDVMPTVGSPVTAIGDSLIKGIIQNWYAGQPFLWAELLSGLDKGKNYYIAEQINRLAKVGTEVKAGQPLAYVAPTGTAIEVGWASSTGQTLARSLGETKGEVGSRGTKAGTSFASFYNALQQGKAIAGGIGETFKEIIAPKIKGGGAVGQIAQGALNLATRAANIYLSKHVGTSAASAAGEASGQKAGSAQGIGGWVRTGATVDPTQGQAPTYSAHGGFSFAELLEAGSNAGVRPDLTQLLGEPRSSYGMPMETSIKVRMPGSNRAYTIWKNDVGSGQAGNSHYTIDLHQSIANALGWKPNEDVEVAKMAAGGMVGSHIRRMAVRHIRQKILKFAQGGIAPWGGRPVPIIAHEGERIMNPAQYSETARLAGTSPGGLDKHLGYDGSPRQSFAGGGAPVALKSWEQAITPSDLPNLSSEFSIGTLNSIVNIFKSIKEGFKKLNHIAKKRYNSELEKYVNDIIIETTGVLARLQIGREKFKASLERKAVGKEYVKSGSKIKLGPKGELGIAEYSEKNLSEESKYLQEEENIIKRTIRETKKLKPKNKKEKDAKSTALKTLALKQKELGETIDQNIEARYQAETRTIQARITEANNQYQVASQELTTKISKAQALGNLGEVGSLEEQTSTTAKAQIDKLRPMLAQAQAIGNKELESSIKQEIIGLEQTINSAVVEKISVAQTLIQRESAKAEAKSGERLGLSKVLSSEGKYEAAGREEKAGLSEKQANLLAAKVQEEALKEQALREGDTAAAITLGEELNKNSTEIAENNLALRENAVITRELIISQIEATGQFKSGIYSAAQQGLETLGKTTGFTNVGGLISAAKGREGALSEERTGLEREGQSIGLGVEGMSPAEILTYLASPMGQMKLKELESHEDKAEKEQMYKLVQALESNANNTLKNTEELAKLNGQLNQPQSWSTAAFNSFRTSFFSGMGGLLEPYSAALPPGSRPEGMPEYGKGSPGRATSSSRTHIENINLTHPVERPDPALFAEELSYHIATTPPTS